jgi:uncharacterized protein with PQ loop repeat|tara:strand:- start:541 stop:819 length:279 start_codon:yes stop_codon:yes gene_type:complete
MNTKKLESIATVIGVMSMIPQAQQVALEKDFSKYSLETTVLSLISVLLWSVYEYRKQNWLTLTTTLLGLLINLRILHGLLMKKEKKELALSQ